MTLGKAALSAKTFFQRELAAEDSLPAALPEAGGRKPFIPEGDLGDGSQSTRGSTPGPLQLNPCVESRTFHF